MKKIIAFGNPFIKEDNLALRLVDFLKIDGYEFIKSENPQDIMLHKELFAIMDVAYGISDVKIIDDIDRINPKKLSSLHDFDLSFFIKLMNKLGRLDKMRMIVIPAKMSIENAKKEVEKILQNHVL